MTNTTTLNKAQETKLGSFDHTSTKIRYLNSLGWSRGQISKQLKVKYQHVRNVLITPVNNPSEQF